MDDLLDFIVVVFVCMLAHIAMNPEAVSIDPWFGFSKPMQVLD